MSVASHASTASPGLQIIYNLVGIALVLLLGGVGIAYGLAAITEPTRPAPLLDDSGPRVERTIIGHELSIPATWFRYGEQSAAGFSSQVDLMIPLPIGPDGTSVDVDVSLVPKSRARPSSALVDGVYLHQFREQQVKGPVGLVGKPLNDGDGFEGETVWYDALSADPFVAKCAAPVDDNAHSRCLRTVVLPGGIAAIYAFDAIALEGWRRFDAEIAPWLERIGAIH